MSVRVKKDFVIEQMKKHNLPYFILMDGKNVIAERQDEGAIEANQEELSEILETLEGDLVTVILRSKNKSEIAGGGRDYSKRSFLVRLKEAGQMNSPAANNMALMNTIMQLKEDKIRMEYEARFKALEEKESDQGVIGYLPQIMEALPHIKGLFPGIFGGNNTPGIAGHPEDNTRLNKALQLWSVVDPDYIAMIEKIASLANKSPDKYNAYKPVIMQQ